MAAQEAMPSPAPSSPKRPRLSPPKLEERLCSPAHPAAGSAAASSPGRSGRRPRWAELPQDLGVLVCQCLGPNAMVRFLLAGRRTRDVSGCEEVWRFFCHARWGGSANLGLYRSARDLYLDSNGWFPQRCGRKHKPRFEAQQVTLHNSPCLTMDMRMTNEEIVTVSEAAKDKNGVARKACVHVVDHDTLRVRQRFEASTSTINCCDVGLGAICLGSDDFKVRLYRQVGRSSADGCADSAGTYHLASEFLCTSEVNDLRFAREDTVVAVRTHQNRHPAGLDLIPVQRPEARVSFPGGSAATRGKYIHALDGFEEGCSLSGIACSGEDATTSAFSAMLFDFRRSAPCVVELPVTSQQQGHPHATMLWPLRAGRAPQVYANLLHEEGRHNEGGTIAMVDFRFPSMEVAELYHVPSPVDDFRCLEGCIYAACTESTSSGKRLRVHRCVPNKPNASECLCTVVEAYDAGERIPREDLKVFSICPRGFAMSHGEHLSLGRLTEPLGRFDRGDGETEAFTCAGGALPPASPSIRRRGGLLVGEEYSSWRDICTH